MSEQTVKTASKAYGYNYASLADIANAGFKIPKMRVTPTEFGEYIEYYDEAVKEWFFGAKVVVPDMKSSNEAQKYGAGLTYARRYTAMLALGLVSDDDTKVETQSKAQADYNAAKNAKKSGEISPYKHDIDFDTIDENLAMLDDAGSVDKYAQELSAALPDLTFAQKRIIREKFAKKRLEVAQNGTA